MNERITGLENALVILRIARVECADNYIAWLKLKNARQAIERELSSMIEDSE